MQCLAVPWPVVRLTLDIPAHSETIAASEIASDTARPEATSTQSIYDSRLGLPSLVFTVFHQSYGG